MISQLILIWLYSSLQKRAKPESGLTHEAAEYSIESFEFIVSEQVQINPDSSRAMSALTFLLFKLNTLQTKIVKL